MSFLSPLFFLGLGAIVVPILVHLIQRERKRVVEFPSLMFIQKIPYQSVRRRRIRHWFLLLMRAAAIALLVAAFARPFLPGGSAAIIAAGGNRELVILLDNSASMGYADRWQRARRCRAQRRRFDDHGRSGDARAVRTQRRGKHPRHLGPRTPRGGNRRGESDLRRDALWSRAEARRKHPVAVDASAPRSGPDLRLPEVGLDRRRRHQVRREHHAHPRVGRPA